MSNNVSATEAMKAAEELSKGNSVLPDDLAKKQAQMILQEQSEDKKKGDKQ